MSKVLILTSDLYSRIGGGEHVYRTLIADNPEVEFFFFTSKVKRNSLLPANVHEILLIPKPTLNSRKQTAQYQSRKVQDKRVLLNPTQVRAAELAEQYARSAMGHQFDIIDIPEYEIVGDYIREALERNGIKFRAISLFIHGALSRTLELEGNLSKESIVEIMALEKLQRAQADVFFTLDSWYPKQLSIEPDDCLQINPWLFTKQTENSKVETLKANPRLVYFGRWERRKGIDLLPSLVKYINLERLGVLLTGDSRANIELFESVGKSFKNRDVMVQELKTTNPEEVYANISNTDILVIPSRFDSFNLIALEALALGKHVAISKECGVFHFLKGKYPEIYFTEIDPNNLAFSGQVLSKSLENLSMATVKILSNTAQCRSILTTIDRTQYTKLVEKYLKSKGIPSRYEHTGLVFKKFSLERKLVRTAKKFSLRKSFLYFTFYKTYFERFASNLYRKYDLIPLLIRCFQSSRITNGLLRKLDRQGKNLILRPRNFLELSDDPRYLSLRRLTYAIRSLRLGGYWSNKVNSKNLISNLHLIGLTEESKALAVILEDPTGSKVFQYLEGRRIALKRAPLFTFDSAFTLESKALGSAPRISIIVSSYNATAKMRVFLERLSLCPELLNGAAEILLIDANSNSPDAEMALRIANEFGIALRAIRVRRRITIQEAWNFGIMNARGKYLSFLGVDETIYPTTLTELASALDLDNSIDWVMADSIVTEVGNDGEYIRDIMKYDRIGADIASPFLETCYVSYVAGMYRKDIHERYGYYDPTFRGAGDTEFKSRVLPSLKVHYLNSTLGEFLNYPEERTTANERIELEDIRAWYIFRTIGGLRYQTSLAPEDFLESLGRKSLGYRKSYCGHISTDIEIASAVYQIAKLEKHGLTESLLSELRNADQQLQSLRIFLGFGPHKWSSLSLRQLISLTKWFDSEYRKSPAKGARRMRLDNIFEQHIWYW